MKKAQAKRGSSVPTVDSKKIDADALSPSEGRRFSKQSVGSELCELDSRELLDTIGNKMQKRKMATAKRLSELQIQKDQMIDDETPILKDRIMAFLMGDYFDYFIGVVLVLNAVWIGIQTEQQTFSINPEFATYSVSIDFMFLIIFTAELSFRIYMQGWRKFFSLHDGWQWNAFDSILVATQAVDQLVSLVFALDPAGDSDSGQGATNALKTLRLFRLLRLVRMVRLIPELKSMVYLILASMSSFFWTVVLMLLLMYVFSIYFTEAASWAYASSELGATEKTELTRNWGTIGSSVLSLFMSITGGDDWRNFAGVFEDDIVNTIVFVIYIAFSTLVMLNLVTGVFVDGAQRIIKTEKNQEITALACQMFVEADTDDSNEITWAEFQGIWGSTAMHSYCEACGISSNDADGLFRMLDVDGSQRLTISEFVQGCLGLRQSARVIDVAHLRTFMEESLEHLDRRTLATHKVLLEIAAESRPDPVDMQDWRDPLDTQDLVAEEA